MTPDSKIDLCPEIFDSSLAELKQNFEKKNNLDKNQFLLIGRRHLRTNNSWMHNIETLSKNNNCSLYMNPEDAEIHGIKANDIIIVRIDTSEIEIPVEITEKMKVKTVSLPHGFGHGMKGVKMHVAEKKFRSECEQNNSIPDRSAFRDSCIERSTCIHRKEITLLSI